MRKPISTFVHGVIDYLSAATFPLLPRAMGWSPRVRGVLDAAGGLSAAYSAATKYELGVVKLIPMTAHLKIDAMQGGALLASSLLLDDEDADARAALAGLGVFCLAASFLTDDQPRIRGERKLLRRDRRLARSHRRMLERPHAGEATREGARQARREGEYVSAADI